MEHEESGTLPNSAEEEEEQINTEELRSDNQEITTEQRSDNENATNDSTTEPDQHNGRRYNLRSNRGVPGLRLEHGMANPRSK